MDAAPIGIVVGIRPYCDPAPKLPCSLDAARISLGIDAIDQAPPDLALDAIGPAKLKRRFGDFGHIGPLSFPFAGENGGACYRPTFFVVRNVNGTAA
jgi:hypothetical protein